VHYAPLHADVETLCRILRSGTNVVTPVGFVYPTPRSALDFAALRAACAEGGSSFHGTGVHPGFSGDLLPLIFSRVMTRLDQVQVREVADMRQHPSKAMQEALGSEATAVRSQTYYLDITPPGFDKGTFVQAMAKRLGISTDAVATIGDMQNDLAMFRVSGTSIAMGNATDNVKDQATHVTASNEQDGFAEAMEMILKRNEVA
jgi:hypothetical protein